MCYDSHPIWEDRGMVLSLQTLQLYPFNDKPKQKLKETHKESIPSVGACSTLKCVLYHQFFIRKLAKLWNTHDAGCVNEQFLCFQISTFDKVSIPTITHFPGN